MPLHSDLCIQDKVCTCVVIMYQILEIYVSLCMELDLKMSAWQETQGPNANRDGKNRTGI